MVTSAPRIDSRLVAAAERLDHPPVPIAETSRRVGRVAPELGLVRPGYEQIRVVVQEARVRSRGPSAADVLLDVAFNLRPPTAIMEYVVGTLPPEPRR